MNSVTLSIAIMGLIGLFFGLLLNYFSKRFAITVDDEVRKVYDVLPHMNCGACGTPSCMGFAEAVVKGKLPYDGCRIGKEPVAKKVKIILEA